MQYKAQVAARIWGSRGIINKVIMRARERGSLSK